VNETLREIQRDVHDFIARLAEKTKETVTAIHDETEVYASIIPEMKRCDQLLEGAQAVTRALGFKADV